MCTNSTADDKQTCKILQSISVRGNNQQQDMQTLAQATQRQEKTEIQCRSEWHPNVHVCQHCINFNGMCTLNVDCYHQMLHMFISITGWCNPYGKLLKASHYFCRKGLPTYLKGKPEDRPSIWSLQEYCIHGLAIQYTLRLAKHALWKGFIWNSVHCKSEEGSWQILPKEETLSYFHLRINVNCTLTQCTTDTVQYKTLPSSPWPNNSHYSLKDLLGYHVISHSGIL